MGTAFIILFLLLMAGAFSFVYFALYAINAWGSFLVSPVKYFRDF